MWKKVYDENGYYPVYTTEEYTEDKTEDKATKLWDLAEKVVNSQNPPEGKKKTSKKKKKESS